LIRITHISKKQTTILTIEVKRFPYTVCLSTGV